LRSMEASTPTTAAMPRAIDGFGASLPRAPLLEQ
jgi:hypothetical protein